MRCSLVASDHFFVAQHTFFRAFCRQLFQWACEQRLFIMPGRYVLSRLLLRPLPDLFNRPGLQLPFLFPDTNSQAHFRAAEPAPAKRTTCASLARGCPHSRRRQQIDNARCAKWATTRTRTTPTFALRVRPVGAWHWRRACPCFCASSASNFAPFCLGKYQNEQGQASCKGAFVGAPWPRIVWLVYFAQLTLLHATFSSCSGCLTELGQHQPSSGAGFCNTCSPGYYASSPSHANCRPCLAGTFSNGLQGSCTACPQGTYSDVNLASGCAPCAAGFTPFKDGVAVSAGADGCRGVSW